MSRERQTLIIAGIALALLGFGIYGPISRWIRGGRGPSPLLAGYRVTYRVNILTGDTTRWEVLTVRRPFESSDLVFDQPPASGPPVRSGSAASADGLYDVNGTGAHLIGGRQPGLPSGDQVLLRMMPELLARGLARSGAKTGVVAGRQCRLYVLFEPPVGPIRPLAGDSDHDDICLDGDGLVLSERWTFHGQLVETRDALSVETATPAPLSGITDAGATGAGPDAPTAVADPSPDSFLAPPPAPDGFRTRTPVQFALPDPQQPQIMRASSVVWSFVHGPDVLTVEAGTESGSQVPWKSDDTVTRSIVLDGLGPAETAVRSDGAEVRIDLRRRGLGWVRVRGTGLLSDVVSFSERLRLKSTA